ncbi:MAG TPA: CinA family protein [Candidatus Omnitrophota bacterium]|nr:CinA family protein [Candidatus Omnitrophota bacterium]
MMQIAKKVAHTLIQRHQTLSVAESCTGGFLAHTFTNIPGSSQFFKLGVIAYANEAKTIVLNVPAQTIASKGAVSLLTVKRMAKGVRSILKTDFSVAISGIAGPTGSTEKKPIGLVMIAIASHKRVRAAKFRFHGSRLSIKKQATAKALKLLLALINEK